MTTDGRDQYGSDALPPVGVMIKATALDAPYLEVMARHMIEQAWFPFAERAVIVERPASFTGKYVARSRSSERELDRAINTLLREHVITVAREVNPAPHLVEDITRRYFTDLDRPIPTHAYTGGPIYATLFGLESMSTDYVLQMDADVLFHGGPVSWVRSALHCMAADPTLWLMMTHPGPPAGRAGRSLGPVHRHRPHWDDALSLWRFRHATTRYFLCDRRTLRSQLQLVEHGGGAAPLERCISRALHEHRAYRGNLGNHGSWHLHVWSHDPPFPAWARRLTHVVEAGACPEQQRGRYDLRLDRRRDRETWARIIESVTGTVARVPEPDASANLPPNAAGLATAPITVVIPVRDRGGQRLRNSLRSLRWQTSGPPAEVFVVSHGSRREVDADLRRLCEEESATLIVTGQADQPWNKSLALNIGIRRSTATVPYLMTMDADMMLSPGFLAAVIEHLSRNTPALVLCRISDLPARAAVPSDPQELLGAFDHLRARTRLRARSGSGGIQAARRSFFFGIRGYDEDLVWWGAMDGDLVNRARLVGLSIVWIDDRAAMLHQWHPRKHAVLRNVEQIRSAKVAWRRNHRLMQVRRNIVRRNPKGWGDEVAVSG
jgi:glycosyltransferase involved in cell wall biosynthesis